MLFTLLKKEYIWIVHIYLCSDRLYYKKRVCSIFHEADIQSVLTKIEVDILKGNEVLRNALISIMVNYPAVMDCIRTNHSSVFNYISDCVILNPEGLCMYKVFNPRSEKTMYTFFLENNQLKQPCYTRTLYRTLSDCHDFELAQFMKEIVSKISTFNAFYDADVFMSCFMEHLEEMTVDAIEEILKIYKRNPQCTNRGRHTSDMKVINEYLEKQRATQSK